MFINLNITNLTQLKLKEANCLLKYNFRSDKTILKIEIIKKKVFLKGRELIKIVFIKSHFGGGMILKII